MLHTYVVVNDLKERTRYVSIFSDWRQSNRFNYTNQSVWKRIVKILSESETQMWMNIIMHKPKVTSMSSNSCFKVVCTKVQLMLLRKTPTILTKILQENVCRYRVFIIVKVLVKVLKCSSWIFIIESFANFASSIKRTQEWNYWSLQCWIDHQQKWNYNV